MDRLITDQSVWLEAVEQCLWRVGRDLRSLHSLAVKEYQGGSHPGFISSTQNSLLQGSKPVHRDPRRGGEGSGD